MEPDKHIEKALELVNEHADQYTDTFARIAATERAIAYHARVQAIGCVPSAEFASNHPNPNIIVLRDGTWIRIPKAEKLASDQTIDEHFTK